MNKKPMSGKHFKNTYLEQPLMNKWALLDPV